MRNILLLSLLLLSSVVQAADIPSESDNMWTKRDHNNNCEKAIKMLEKATKQMPDEFTYHWHLARFHYWAAAEARIESEKENHARKGWEAADRANKLQPGSIEGWYWATANIGLYGEAIGTIRAIKEGLGDTYLDYANKAIEIDPLHDDGGPYRSLGRYYTKLPWPMKDLKKSMTLLEKSMEENGARALTLYFYAEAQKDSGDKAGARKSLEKILQFEPNGNNAPEVRRYQRLSKELLEAL